MLKRSITYTDYNGGTRTEDFYFNLTQAEVTEMELSVDGGLVEMINRIVAAQDGKQIIATFKDIILRAYGEKSPDGKRFIKNQELRDAFAQTEACSWSWPPMPTRLRPLSTVLFRPRPLFREPDRVRETGDAGNIHSRRRILRSWERHVSASQGSDAQVGALSGLPFKMGVEMAQGIFGEGAEDSGGVH